jgi:hypothetical protein
MKLSKRGIGGLGRQEKMALAETTKKESEQLAFARDLDIDVKKRLAQNRHLHRKPAEILIDTGFNPILTILLDNPSIRDLGLYGIAKSRLMVNKSKETMGNIETLMRDGRDEALNALLRVSQAFVREFDCVCKREY